MLFFPSETVTTQVTVVKDNIFKEQTTTNENLSTPVVVTIASVSVFVCILLVVLLCIFIVRRRKKSSKNSEPVSGMRYLK
jgi:heme/copper-type cytochrome/quinol oxidase subunit 2